MLATTVDHCKRWLDEQGKGRAIDDRLEQLLGAVSRAIEGLLGTQLELTSREEFPEVTLGSRVLRLQVWPVAEIEEVRYSLTRTWTATGSSLLTEGAEYFADLGSGLIHLESALQTDRQGLVRVTYRAGFAATPEEMEAEAPHIAQAAAMWVGDWQDKGYRISARSLVGPRGEVVPEPALRVPPAVLALLSPPPRIG